MGKRGPPPTPTAILKLRGSWRGKSRGEEPDAGEGAPERPEHLSDDAKKVWECVIETLSKMPGCLAPTDWGQLERYSHFFVAWRDNETEIQLLIDENGSVRSALASESARPALRGMWSERHRLNTALIQIEKEFNLSPASRARTGMALSGEKPETSGKKRFFAS